MLILNEFSTEKEDIQQIIANASRADITFKKGRVQHIMSPQSQVPGPNYMYASMHGRYLQSTYLLYFSVYRKFYGDTCTSHPLFDVSFIILYYDQYLFKYNYV